MKPDSYRQQDGCHGCRHVFVKEDYDDDDEYYCHVDGSERPLCGSVVMGELPAYELRSERRAAGHRQWIEWAEPRAVEPWGICDRFQRKEQTDGN